MKPMVVSDSVHTSWIEPMEPRKVATRNTHLYAVSSFSLGLRKPTLDSP